MRWIKIILIVMGGLVSVGLVLIVIALLTFGHEDYRRIVTRAATRLTGYAITVDGPFSLNLSSEPSLSAEMIKIASEPDKSPPPVTKIGKLRIQVALWPLLTGTLVVKELLVDDVKMAVTIGEGSDPGGHRGDGRRTPEEIDIPILENVRLYNLHLDVIDAAADRRVEVRLQQFHIGDDRENGPLFVKGKGTISGTDFDLDGRLGAVATIFSKADPCPAPVVYTAHMFKKVAVFP